MTAEVAILNKSAVALAADSYVTISASSQSNSNKTYLVNKLFTLSKHRPVGVMVYGSADLLGVPWETIIKEYRRELGRTSFDTIEQYAKHFKAWLGSSDTLFNEEEQRFHFLTTVYAYFDYWIKDTIDESVKKQTENTESISQGEIDKIARETITEHHASLLERPLLEYLPEDFPDRLAEVYQDEIEEACGQLFSGYRLDADVIQQLASIAVNYIIRDVWPTEGLSGVVLAGFGDKQKFPVVTVFSTHRIVLGTLIYRDEDNASENLNETESRLDSPAAICPFAQRDVVDSFLMGIDPHFREVINRYLSRVLHQWSEIVSQSLPELEGVDKNAIVDKLGGASKQMLEVFESEFKKHVGKKHIDPMLETIGVLPKEELAAMAESLVSLTSAKRKMSLDLETVGGPIDVAVITKGDGFLWIKRKHYFKPELNHHFFKNYYDKE